MSLTRNRIFCCFDFETTGKNPHGCQLTQIAAIMIDSQKLEEVPNGRFNIEFRPEFDDEKAIAEGFDPVEQKALEVTKKTKEGLLQAPLPKIAWQEFAAFIKRFNTKGSSFFAPIPVGFNINGFDSHILQRYAKKYSNVDKDGKQNLLHQIYKVDMMDLLFAWFESREDVSKLNLDYLRGYLGFPETSLETAHNALYDVIDTANIFIAFMEFHRKHSNKTTFEKAFASRKMAIEY